MFSARRWARWPLSTTYPTSIEKVARGVLPILGTHRKTARPAPLHDRGPSALLALVRACDVDERWRYLGLRPNYEGRVGFSRPVR